MIKSEQNQSISCYSYSISFAWNKKPQQNSLPVTLIIDMVKSYLNFHHLDIEISHTEGNHGYVNIFCIAIWQFLFREELC